MTMANLSSQIDWNGQWLSFEVETDHGFVACRVPRDTIHVIRLYGDAISREIYLERHRIVDKLAPFLRAKLALLTSSETIELLPSDVED